MSLSQKADLRAHTASEEGPYLADFGLNENPFRLTPSPLYAFLTASTREAIAHTRHLIKGRRGLGIISGEVGTGKSTLARRMFAEREASDDRVAFLYEPPGGSRQTQAGILRTIADELGISLPRGRSAQHTKQIILTQAIEAANTGATMVVFIDDAHRLRKEGIAALLSLLNMQGETAQFVQVVLFGQLPEMANVMTVDAALHSRVAVHTTLNPMTMQDTIKMIAHRLQTAGRDDTHHELFSYEALEALHNYARGIPRVMCTLADLACMRTWDADRDVILREDVDEAAAGLHRHG